MVDEQRDARWDARSGYGSTGPAREAINEMLEAGLLDEVIERVDSGGLTLTGEGGFLPEMVKAVL